MSTTQSAQKKSGIKTFKQGEIIFRENEAADSLFIIQKGQIRLFKPKGRGFIELAVLRAGEVIGEMAYFDEKASRRSCSASAIITTEVIEISFNAFSKTMEGLNPWFKTIINTLADRLRKTNDRVKALESNSVGFGKGGKVGDYKFFTNADIIKFLSLFYLSMKTHSEKKDNWIEMHLNKLKFYIKDIFGLNEIKYEEFIQLLVNNDFIELAPDEDNLPKMIHIKDLEQFRTIMVFINTQRVTDESKQIQISSKCEMFLKKIIDQLTSKGEKNDEALVDISSILEDFAERKVPITDEDLKDAIAANICDDIIVGDSNKLTCKCNYTKLKKIYPSIRMLNAVKKINEDKSKGGAYG